MNRISSWHDRLVSEYLCHYGIQRHQIIRTCASDKEAEDYSKAMLHLELHYTDRNAIVYDPEMLLNSLKTVISILNPNYNGDVGIVISDDEVAIKRKADDVDVISISDDDEEAE